MNDAQTTRPALTAANLRAVYAETYEQALREGLSMAAATTRAVKAQQQIQAYRRAA